MYICPTCSKEFKTENQVVKHFLKCWKQYNPNHESHPAFHNDDIIHREINDDITNFFSSFNERN